MPFAPALTLSGPTSGTRLTKLATAAGPIQRRHYHRSTRCADTGPPVRRNQQLSVHQPDRHSGTSEDLSRRTTRQLRAIQTATGPGIPGTGCGRVPTCLQRASFTRLLHLQHGVGSEYASGSNSARILAGTARAAPRRMAGSHDGESRPAVPDAPQDF